MRSLSLSILALSISPFSVPAVAQSLNTAALCSQFRSAKLQGCVATPRGLVLAETIPEAEQQAERLREAEKIFENNFKKPVPYYAVVGGPLTADLSSRLRAAGLAVQNGWMPRSQLRQVVELRTRAIAGAVAKARKLPPAAATAIEASMVKSALADLEAGRDMVEATTVPHETAHAWFFKAFFPGFEVSAANGHYGSPAPDWLDETAAILAEGPTWTKVRAEDFLNGPRTLSLHKYLTMEHPGKALPGTSPQLSGDREALPTITLQEGPAPAELDTDFYAIGPLFAEFLQERSGQPAILGEITAVIAAGESFENWLQRSGGAYKLGTNYAALERNWKAWLQTKYPRASSKSADNGSRFQPPSQHVRFPPIADI